MGLLRLDSVGIVVDNMDEVVSFFLGLGFIYISDTVKSGAWLESVTGVKGAEIQVTLLQSPQAETHIEFIQYSPEVHLAPPIDPRILRPGFRMVGVLVEDLKGTIDLAVSLGANPIGNGIERVDAFWVSYILAPGNVIIMLAEDVPWDEL